MDRIIKYGTESKHLQKRWERKIDEVFNLLLIENDVSHLGDTHFTHGCTFI